MEMEGPIKKAVKKGDQQQWATYSSSSLITNLPTHILMEILCRLPIKTLLACKSVCKSWLHLIKDTHFAKFHHARADVELLFRLPETIRLYMGEFHFQNNFVDVKLKLNNLPGLPKVSVRPSNVHYSVNRCMVNFVNSCNGLLCYYGCTNMFAIICNPMTSEFMTLPAPKKHNGLSTCYCYGFGFSEKANRYKLMRVMGLKRKGSSDEVFVVEICTLEEGCSWKNVGACLYSIWRPFGCQYSLQDKSVDAIFLGGALHWICKDSHCGDIARLVSFDFEDEQFGEVPFPHDFGEVDKHRNTYNPLKIGVLRGCLSITEVTKEGVDVWVMKEYNVKDSWTKAFSIEFSTPNETRFYSTCVAINYLDNDEILMKRCGGWASDADVFLYNPILKSIRSIGSAPGSVRVIPYNPSLVLLKDAMMGYNVHVKPRCSDMELREEAKTPHWWRNKDEKFVAKSPQPQGSKPPRSNDEICVSVTGEESNGCLSGMELVQTPTSVSSVQETSAVEIADQERPEAPLKNDEICFPVTGGDSCGNVNGIRLVQTPTSVHSLQDTSAADLAHEKGSEAPLRNIDEICVNVTREERLGLVQTPTSDSIRHDSIEELMERLRTMIGQELREELRKERQQRQEERLRNEQAKVELLKEQRQQSEQIKQLEERLRNEQAKVEQLKEQIQQSEQVKQQNQQMILQMMDEVRVRLVGPPQ